MQPQNQVMFSKIKSEHDAFNDFRSSSATNSSQDSVEKCLENKSQKVSDDVYLDEHDEHVQSPESAQNQIVIYRTDTSDGSKALSVSGTLGHESVPKFAKSNDFTRVLPSIGEFTVQCAACFKWRIIPSKEKYEEIRHHIQEDPFLCEKAREWRPNVTCDDPADISPDNSRLWAIDKPSISQPPTGWQRTVRIRAEGSTRFADVYYISPTGKTLRSKVEVHKYLLEHPEFIRAGVNLSQFSFQIPKPLQENYVRKRTYKKAKPQHHVNAFVLPGPLQPVEVRPLAWVAPDKRPKYPIFTRPDGTSAPNTAEAPGFKLFDVFQPVKRQATGQPSGQYIGALDGQLKFKKP